MVPSILSGLNMNAFLQKLIDSDSKSEDYATDQAIIAQGLALVKAKTNPSHTLLKASLLERAKFQNWQAKASELFLELDRRNIRFLVFKGFAYSSLLYNNTALRPYSDIDILIQFEDYQQISKLLNELSYQCYPSRQGEFVSFQNTFFDGQPLQTLFDVHWQINNRIEFHRHFVFDELFQSAQVIELGDLAFKTLNNCLAFIHGSFHYLAHRPEDRKHIWLYDLALLWHGMSVSQHEECVLLAQKKQQSEIISKVLILLTETFGKLIKHNVNNVNLAVNTRETTSPYADERNKKISDIRTRLRNIPGFRTKLKFLSEYLFQSKVYMQNRYQLKSQNWVLFYYPRMWIEDFIKLFK